MALFRQENTLRTEYVAVGDKPKGDIHFNTQNEFGAPILHTPIIMVCDDKNRDQIKGFIFPLKHREIDGMIFHGDLKFERYDNCCYFPLVLRPVEIQNNLKYFISTNATTAFLRIDDDELGNFFRKSADEINKILL